MEHKKDAIGLLDLIDAPAFCVNDGAVIRVNDAARRRGIEEGTDIGILLETGAREYAAYQDGCLYLTLRLCGASCGASVTRMDGFDIFRMEDDRENTELQAMALAAQELRQPLTNVMTVANQLFPLTDDGADPAVQEYIARINRGLFQMQRIIANMSDAYRYEQEKHSQKKTIDVCAFVNELFANAAPLIRYTGMQLQYTAHTESIFCLIDEEKLERAVNNILSNALKFAPKNGTITAKLTRKGTMLYLTVQDSGAIREDLRQNVFNRFRRVPGVEDSRYGIGLGMVLIRNAAMIHGGTVLLEQSEAIGNRLTMTLLIEQNQKSVQTPIYPVDYTGGWDHKLLELSDALPADLYRKDKVN